ncbi:stealth conserved region 3 domain-containing protein [Spongiibacter nanhainus]|uniref:Stealth conserved region 3 domain-containing protein n=1 Tax=Spongiibacter nanhainus TaxID=2794344 RepID=A0A7T4R266_9GAMM|nr:stealth conserved region 3 domain-containing protein [Spongiibacter nanhainus]QQD19091.1 stealth conserved region 3 domain-containing protein [Spongiibacter nanhainus]
MLVNFKFLKFHFYNKRNLKKSNPKSAGEARKNNFNEVCRLLNAAGIKYTLVPIDSYDEFRTRVGISWKDRIQFQDVLEAYSGACIFAGYGAPILPVGWGASKGFFRRMERSIERDELWFFYIGYKNKAATLLSRLCACEIDFYTETAEEIVFNRSNDVSKIISCVQSICSVNFLENSVPIFSTFVEFVPLRKFPKELDIVYTWVDGDDREWQKLKSIYDEKIESNDDAFGPGRFKSRGELKYSLRSLAFNSTLYRKVFIVTNGQVPNWLNTNHPKVVVVDHQDIFRNPEESLPTFNSHAIESNLHRIDGLGEYFIYKNDDFFFYNPIQKSNLFTTTGVPLVFTNRVNSYGLVPPNDQVSPYANAWRNTSNIINETFGVLYTNTVKHVPYLVSRSCAYEIEGIYKEKLCKTEKNRFRGKDDVSMPASLCQIWSLAKNKAVEADCRSRTLTLSRSMDMVWALQSLLIFSAVEFLCLNEEGQQNYRDQRTIDRRVVRFMNRSFPLKSEFEK